MCACKTTLCVPCGNNNLRCILWITIVQIAEWIRGSKSAEILRFKESADATTHGSGSKFHHSLDTWRTFIRQAWLLGMLVRTMRIGSGIQNSKCVIFNVLSVSENGLEFLSQPSDIALPVSAVDHTATSSADSSSKRTTTGCLKSTRKTKILPTIHNLLSSHDNWFEIKEATDYQYPGIFHEPVPKRLGYCADITQMPMYHPFSEDFLFSDIQFGKGTARHTRKVSLSVDNKKEELSHVKEWKCAANEMKDVLTLCQLVKPVVAHIKILLWCSLVSVE